MAKHGGLKHVATFYGHDVNRLPRTDPLAQPLRGTLRLCGSRLLRRPQHGVEQRAIGMPNTQGSGPLSWRGSRSDRLSFTKPIRRRTTTYTHCWNVPGEKRHTGCTPCRRRIESAVKVEATVIGETTDGPCLSPSTKLRVDSASWSVLLSLASVRSA